MTTDRALLHHVTGHDSLGFQFDVIAAVHTIKLLNIIDEYTKESLAIVVDRSIGTDTTVSTLE
jgi:hypothetical protein